MEKKIADYGGRLDDGYQRAFLPTIEVMGLQCLSWEEAINWIYTEIVVEADQIQNYYALCLEFN